MPALEPVRRCCSARVKKYTATAMKAQATVIAKNEPLTSAATRSAAPTNTTPPVRTTAKRRNTLEAPG